MRIIVFVENNILFLQEIYYKTKFEDKATALEKGNKTVEYVMKLQVQVENNTIVDAKFKTFGCGSAIASSSLATEWIKGKKLDDALAITNSDISEELALPPVKIHCSVLAEDAIKAAIKDYKDKQLSN